MIVPYPAAPEYGVTRDGRVFRIVKAKFGRDVPYEVSTILGDTGYLFVAIRGKHVKVHRVVAATFLSNPEHKTDVAHRDGVRTNNRVDNLRWATRKENMNDARGHGTFPPRGEMCGTHILTEAEVLDIKRSFASRGVDLARKYGVSQQIICDIRKGRRWAHVGA